MNIGFAACGITMLFFVVAGALFTLLKERAAMLISGFNTLPAKYCARVNRCIPWFPRG